MEILSKKKSKRMEVDFTNPTPPFPREAIFDLNNTCNCKCFFCANSKISERAYLDRDLGFRLLKEFYDMGTREVALYATGEPFLRDDLVDFVGEAKKIGYEYVFITSNGCLATPERSEPVLRAGLDSIKFSVNAGTKESYIKVHGVDMFDTVIENIKWFKKFREESGLHYKIYISMVVSSMTRGEWSVLRKILLPYVDEMDHRGCSNQGGNMIDNNRTEKIEKDNLLGSLKKEQFLGKCPDVFFRATVTPQGFMSACVADYQNYLIVADLNKTTAEEAWSCESFVNLRKKHIANNLTGMLCDNCLNNVDRPVSPLIPACARPFKKKGKHEK